MYLPASLVTAVANVATPRNTVLQHAGAGWPNAQLNRRPPPDKKLVANKIADGVVVVFDTTAIFVAKMYPKAQLVKNPN
jgi:hypothetical protein